MYMMNLMYIKVVDACCKHVIHKYKMYIVYKYIKKRFSVGHYSVNFLRWNFVVCVVCVYIVL